MALLVLLNGPPASGKSTVARQLVAKRPLALDLDVDLVRSQLGRWLDDSMAAGRAARVLALAMARTHLSAGHDVFVPQFVARPGFAEELAATAAECGAAFVSVALMIDRDTARSSFAARSRRPTEVTHRDAAALVEHSSTPDPIGAMFDRWCEYLHGEQDVERIDAVRGEIDATVCAVEQVLADALRAGR